MYTNIRKKVNKFANGGKIPKYLTSWGLGILSIDDPKSEAYWKNLGYSDSEAKLLVALYNSGAKDANGNFISKGSNQTATIETTDYAKLLKINNIKRHNELAGINPSTIQSIDFGDEDDEYDASKVEWGENSAFALSIKKDQLKAMSQLNNTDVLLDNTTHLLELDKEMFKTGAESIAKLIGGATAGYLGGATGAQGALGIASAIEGLKSGALSGGGGAAGIIGGAMQVASGVIDKLFFADKNFSGTSLVIDSAVHGISGAIAGIVPWGTLAAGVLESVNMATKAGGSTVQGYDVNINSSGYSQDMIHEDSSSSRGLFGLDFGNTEEKLAKRNRNLEMAMKAATIDEQNTFELEARANSILNTIMNNLIALSGGLETNMLAG